MIYAAWTQIFGTKLINHVLVERMAETVDNLMSKFYVIDTTYSL